jgi:phage tail-like protein
VPEAQRLVLRRGATGALDLYGWWLLAWQGRAPQGRVVQVTLLAEDNHTAVMTWRFRNARPLALSYTPLDANSDALLIETIELAFDHYEIA